MERINSEGVPRDQLLLTLKDRRKVMEARRANLCLLCHWKGVNEAALCQVCYSTLEPPELALATRWMMGIGP